MKGIFLLLRALYEGQELANGTAWRKGAITGAALLLMASPLVAALRSFGLDIPLDDSQMAKLCDGAAVLLGLVVHVATDKNLGLRPRTAAPTEAGSDARVQEQPRDEPDIRDPGGA